MFFLAGKTENIEGKTFGKFFVVSRSLKKGPGGNVLWYCACDCGNFSIVSGGDLKRRHNANCGCERVRKLRDQRGVKNPMFKHGKYTKENFKFSAYEYAAKYRNHSFSLTLDTFRELTAGHCHYCGDPNCGGIDRVDNSLGYIDGNVVGCCGLCNKMKHVNSKQKFLTQIRKIFNNLG